MKKLLLTLALMFCAVFAHASTGHITNLTLTAKTQTSAVFTFNTTIDGSTQGLSFDSDCSSNEHGWNMSVADSQAHTITITGLTQGTAYCFQPRSLDNNIDFGYMDCSGVCSWVFTTDSPPTATTTTTPTKTPTLTRTRTVTPSITITFTRTVTPTITPATFTPTPTPRPVIYESLPRWINYLPGSPGSSPGTPLYVIVETPSYTSTITVTSTRTSTSTITPSITKTITVTSTVTPTSTASPTVTQTPTATPVVIAEYLLENNVNDASGNGRTGSISGTVPFQSVTGFCQGSYAAGPFASGYISPPASVLTAFSSLNNYTVSFYIYTTSLSTTQYVHEWTNGSGTNSVRVSTNGSINFWWNGTSGASSGASGVIVANTCELITYGQLSGARFATVNGVTQSLTGATTAASTGTVSDFRLGARSAGTQPLVGFEDDFKISTP